MSDLQIPVSRECSLQLGKSLDKHNLSQFMDYELVATFLDDLKAGSPAVLQYLKQTAIRSNDLAEILNESEIEQISRLFNLYKKETVSDNAMADELLQDLYRSYQDTCISRFLYPKGLPTFLEDAEHIYWENSKKALS